ncbi:MAG: outer membrane lipoprotein carrier protein LolA [Clostridiales bacterium]|nr:outer membrane lipoprotein carrier protein LolA [Clostridiales bacterium]
MSKFFKMLKCFKATLAIGILACICGCSGESAEERTDVKEKITSMSGYSCEAEINVKSNKGQNNYSARISWEKSGKYKIETKSPEILKGNVILFDGKGLWQYNPNIESKISLSKTGGDFDGKSKIFISEFMKSYLSGSDSSEEEVLFGGKKYNVLLANVGGGKYFAYQKLWIDVEEEVPFRLQTFDDKNNTVFSADFSDFKFDSDFSEDEFLIPGLNAD